MSPPLEGRALARVAIRLAIWAFVGLVVASCAAYVWPTRYRYDHMTDDGETYIVRIDRFTGDADVLLPNEGWVPVEDEDGSGSDGGNNGI